MYIPGSFRLVKTHSVNPDIKFALHKYGKHLVELVTQEQLAKKALIMVVDDEQDALNVFSTYLTRQGYNVHAFSSPEIALEHFKYSPKECSLIISDVRMPKMSGFQLARKAKELNPDVKVILTSSFEVNMSEFNSVLPNAPVDCFLDKPISLNKLTEMVNKQLSI